MDLSADVLLLPHHGGLTPSTAAFVEAVQPRYLIQSSSRSTSATLERLGGIVGDGRLFNTADDGAIRIVLGGAEIEVSGFRSADVEAG
jgi:competence protein ComEC